MLSGRDVFLNLEIDVADEESFELVTFLSEQTALNHSSIKNGNVSVTCIAGMIFWEGVG
jgi:hypothetical protein